eukprot:301132-Rhodomonas_salina.2
MMLQSMMLPSASRPDVLTEPWCGASAGHQLRVAVLGLCHAVPRWHAHGLAHPGSARLDGCHQAHHQRRVLGRGNLVGVSLRAKPLGNAGR